MYSPSGEKPKTSAPSSKFQRRPRGGEREPATWGWFQVARSGDASANRYGVSRVDVSSRWGLGCGDVRRSRRRRRRRRRRGWWRGWKGRNERAAAWNRARVERRLQRGSIQRWTKVHSHLPPRRGCGREGRREKTPGEGDVEGCNAGMAAAGRRRRAVGLKGEGE